MSKDRNEITPEELRRIREQAKAAGSKVKSGLREAAEQMRKEREAQSRKPEAS